MGQVQAPVYLVSSCEQVEKLAKAGVLTGLRAEKAFAAANAMRNAIKIAKRELAGQGIPT